MDRCTEILERHNWDVETAIHDHLGPDPREMVQPVREVPLFHQHQNGQTSIQRPFRNIQRPQMSDSIFQRIATLLFNPFIEDSRGYWPLPNQRPQGFTGWLLFLTTLPLRVVVVTFYQFTSFVFRIIRPETRPGYSFSIVYYWMIINSFNYHYSYNRSNRQCNIFHSRL